MKKMSYCMLNLPPVGTSMRCQLAAMRSLGRNCRAEDFRPAR